MGNRIGPVPLIASECHRCHAGKRQGAELSRSGKCLQFASSQYSPCVLLLCRPASTQTGMREGFAPRRDAAPSSRQGGLFADTVPASHRPLRVPLAGLCKATPAVPEELWRMPGGILAPIPTGSGLGACL